MEPFSSFEIQLIRASLTNRTDEEIADLLERSVDEVAEKIKELVPDRLIERTVSLAEIKLQKDFANRKETRKKYVKEKNQEEVKRQNRSKEELTKARNLEEKRKLEKSQMHQFRKYKSLVVDYSKMKSVRVNQNTFIMIPIEANEKEAIEQYEKHRQALPYCPARGKPGVNKKPKQ